MNIHLITEDFKGSIYMSNDDCPLARALKRYFPNAEIAVGGTRLVINGKGYIFNDYKWSRRTVVDPLIKKANAGETVEYQLDIPGLSRY